MKLFNDNWYFLKTAAGTEYEDIAGSLELFSPVDIPHDWLIYQVEDLYETGTGWYLKRVDGAALRGGAGGRVLLVFDGVYMDSTVYVNGRRVGDWKYGYSAFSFDITDFIEDGENLLTVQVRFESPNSRWYSGAGIYRNVWLHRYPAVYLPLDGIYVNARAQEDMPPYAYRLLAEAECGGAVDGDTCCRFSLWKDDAPVAELGWCRQAEKHGDNTVFCMDAVVRDVAEWDIDAPVCYRLRIELYRSMQENTPVDIQETVIGFRRMEFDAARGFFLNGRSVKVHGVCEHHDFGCLGAAFHKEAMRRKLSILKTMGVNALRTSHNMPAREVMALADEMGILVLSEAFDMWEQPKTRYDYARFFKEWARKDVRSWIRRDRNHPSLLMWSIGNEIYDTHADAHGEEITGRLVGFVRENDPKANAPITIGSNYMPWEGAQRCADIVKFAGYNYGEAYYAQHHARHPDWIIYGSETASTVQSRGVYKFPLSQSVLADEDGQCSSLGNAATSWGAKSTEACIIADRDAAFCFGQFVWTGFDYIGEPTPYHTKNSYFGQLDTAGFPKDSFYIYQAEWTDARTAPMVHVFPYWCFNEGQLIDVRACSNGASVELFVNGVSQGVQEIDHAYGQTLVCNWQVPYSAGEITAVAYDADGAEIARQTRYSFGEGKKLTIVSDKDGLLGNGEDLAFLTVAVEDAQGHPVENAADYVAVSVEGSGRLLGLDNGDSTDEDAYKGCVRKLFNGKLLVVVASRAEEGAVRITVSSPYLETAQCVLPVAGAAAAEGVSVQENVCDTDAAKLPDALRGLPVPVRQIRLAAAEGTTLTKEKPSAVVSAQILPENASDTALIWKAVNAAGIEIPYAEIVPVCAQGSVCRAQVTARGDGEFYVRCMSQSGTRQVRIISQLEFRAQGIGAALLNPYEFVSAGLYSETFGEVGNGNEKGIATARDGASGVWFSDLDFGDYGSDEITIPIFALSSEPYPIEIWLGKPQEAGSELLLEGTYCKPSVWNTYQEETWKLKRRVKGTADISIRMYQKAHIKGFCFKRYEKAFCRLAAAECSSIYGDSFTVSGDEITGIGNNVTVSYENMDFGAEGASGITLCGRSALAKNTVHIHLVHADGQTDTRILEIPGTEEYEEEHFEIDPLCGCGTVEFIFLPGSCFDLKAFCFRR